MIFYRSAQVADRNRRQYRHTTRLLYTTTARLATPGTFSNYNVHTIPLCHSGHRRSVGQDNTLFSRRDVIIKTKTPLQQFYNIA